MLLKSKLTLLLFLLLAIVVLVFYIQKRTNDNSSIIKVGQYPLTVQFISDTPGYVNIFTLNDTLRMEGQTISNDRSGYLFLKGYIENIVKDSFTYVGPIKIYSDGCCGEVWKKGKWNFRKIGGRNFYRLKEREAICDPYTCYYYIDIHLSK
jgi:hypothetical protein